MIGSKDILFVLVTTKPKFISVAIALCNGPKKKKMKKKMVLGLSLCPTSWNEKRKNIRRSSFALRAPYF